MVTTAAELANETNPSNVGVADPSASTAPVVRKSKSFKRIRGLLRVGGGGGGGSSHSTTNSSSGESRRSRLRGRKAASSIGLNETSTTPTAANLSSITTTSTTTPGGTSSTATNVHQSTNNNMADASFISTTSSGMIFNDSNMIMNDDVDDMSAINPHYYNVDVDERSVITQRSTVTNNLFGTTSGTDDRLGRDITSRINTAYILKVVLLLMDPETRRFELLQLEFDSFKALVSDVLAQIPISVTEDTLRKQHYIAIANQYGTEMIPSQLLSSFCKGNEVLVAIPSNVSTTECIRLARPILSDENVVAMVRKEKHRHFVS
jgi:hypothetical protein